MRAAIVYTLVATAKLHHVEPWQYLKDILQRIPDNPHKTVADLPLKTGPPNKI